MTARCSGCVAHGNQTTHGGRCDRETARFDRHAEGGAVGDTARRLHRKPSFEKTGIPRIIEYCDQCVGFGLEVRQQDTVVVQPRTYDRQKIRGCNFRRTRDAHRNCFPGSPHDAIPERAGERKVPLRGDGGPFPSALAGFTSGRWDRNPSGLRRGQSQPPLVRTAARAARWRSFTPSPGMQPLKATSVPDRQRR
jgi:hypothetical protein